MNEALEQRLQKIAQERNYQWPAGELAEALRLGAEAAMECQWLPIETAPKSGRQMILLFIPKMLPMASISSSWHKSGFYLYNKPTHWMPIKKPQKVKK